MDRVNTLAIRRSLLAQEPPTLAGKAAINWMDDLKLFAAAAIGGFVFFSTFIG